MSSQNGPSSKYSMIYTPGKGLSLPPTSQVGSGSVVAFGTSFPPKPSFGALCYRTDQYVLYCWNGSAWDPVATPGYGPGFPDPAQGQLFYRTDLAALYLYYQSTWHPVGGSTTINGQSGPFTFNGPGVSNVGSTFTFSGGGGGGPYPFTIVQTAQNATFTVHSSSITVTFPQTAASSGNTLIAFVFWDAPSQTLTTPSGWTLIGSHSSSPYSGCAVFQKTTASDTSVTFSWGGSDFGSAIVWEVVGSRTVSLGFASDATTTDSATFVRMPGMTVSANSWPIFLVAFVQSAATMISPPAGYDIFICDMTGAARMATVIAARAAASNTTVPGFFVSNPAAGYQSSITAAIGIYVT
jgi:hypothetical protein